MSGAISTGIGVISGLSSSISAINRQLNGNSIAAISIGNITLRDFEIPEEVMFGGGQQMTVHKFVGGARVVDVMGRDDGDITWSGMMIGPDAAQRARAIDLLRRGGAQQSLIIGEFAENVVIKQFEAHYRRENWIGGYTISCVVVSDPAPSSGGASLLDSANGGLLSGLGALGTGIAAITNTISPVIASAQTALSAIGDIVLPVTTALGIHVPFLSNAQTLLSLAQGSLLPLASLSNGLTALSATQTSVGYADSYVTGGIAQTSDVISSISDGAPPDAIVADGPSLTAATAAAGQHAVLVNTAGHVATAKAVVQTMTTDSPQAPAGVLQPLGDQPAFNTTTGLLETPPAPPPSPTPPPGFFDMNAIIP